MSKRFQSKVGNDDIGYATREYIEKLRKEYGEDFPYNSILVGRDDFPYAVIYRHKCNKWVTFLLRPLIEDTLKGLLRLLNQPKMLHKFILDSKEHKV